MPSVEFKYSLVQLCSMVIIKSILIISSVFTQSASSLSGRLRFRNTFVAQSGKTHFGIQVHHLHNLNIISTLTPNKSVSAMEIRLVDLWLRTSLLLYVYLPHSVSR
jgi:hypothetical protein